MKANDLGFLVVDDDDFLRNATMMLLKSLSASRVLEAANGAQALDVLAQAAAPPDIILCDLNMPGMDGMEFLRHLGATQANAAVIIVSSHEDALLSSVRKMASAYGVRVLGTVHKPVSRRLLETFIKNYKPAQPAAPPPVKPAIPEFSLDDILRGVEARQFEPFYQPKVDFETGRITGAEALARWIHPVHGVVAPYAFIGALETSGQIGALTFLILEKAAAACRQLRDKGNLISVSVNLSPVLLDDVSVADRITQAAQKAGVDPRHIILEITESATMTEVAASLETLARLRMRGFGLSIDDFGTGASNIQQMTRVAFSELKIDQSFVRNCADNPALAVVVKTSIEMAHQLKIKCTGEGVETQKDWDALKAMECDTAQGYFIARPMDLASFMEFCVTYPSRDKRA